MNDCQAGVKAALAQYISPVEKDLGGWGRTEEMFSTRFKTVVPRVQIFNVLPAEEPTDDTANRAPTALKYDDYSVTGKSKC